MTLTPQPDLGTPAREGAPVTLTVDGAQVTVPEGTSVMRAAALADRSVPKLCATDGVEAWGSCRMCLVEIEGVRGTPSSCTTPVRAGMTVTTSSPRLERLRRGVMELYISDHPLDCLTCAANGDCELQDTAGAVGLREVRYGMAGDNHFDAEHKAPVDISNPYFQYDPSKCIVCSRCVRACEEVQGTFALTIEGRGFDSRVSAGTGGDDFFGSDCVSCGACVQACPTATLVEKSVVDHGTPTRSVDTTCAYCGVGCSFRAELQGDTVVRMVPDKSGGANEGHSCVKGRFAWGYATHKDRVMHPMVRERITDPWREVSWDEAIAFAADRFRTIQQSHGTGAIGGITSSRCTNEEVYVVQKMIRAAFGNNNVDTCARVCHSPTGYGLKQTFGTSAGTQNFKSVEQADVVLLIGANPTDAHPVFASRMKKRLRQGAELIVVDPRRIDLVRTPHIAAAHHVQLRPGTNVAVMNALAHTIVTEGLVDEAFVQARCDLEAFDRWRAFVAEPRNAPEALAETIGVPAETLRAAARLYATGGNAAIYYGLGVTEHSQGSTMVMAMANLAMATGNIGREGVGVNPLRGQNNVQGSCDMGSFPHELPGYRHVSDAATRAQFEADWGVDLLAEPGLRIPNMLAAAVDGTFRGLFVQGEDIAQSDPNTQHVQDALQAMDCVVVQDLFLNETAAFEGRHLHQRRAADQPGAPGDGGEDRSVGVGDGVPPRHRDRLSHALRRAGRDHGRDRPPDAVLRGGQPRPPGRRGLAAMAGQRGPPGRCADHACRRLRPRQGPVHADRIRRDRGAGEPLLPADPDHRPDPQPVQCRRPDPADRERPLAHQRCPGDPPLRRRGAGHRRGRHGAGRQPGRRHHAARRTVRPDAPGRGLHHLPPPGERRQRRHHRAFGLGDQLPRIQGNRGPDHPLQPAVGLAGAPSPAGGGELPRRDGGRVRAAQ
jgi:formate dehydrogenase major subunit